MLLELNEDCLHALCRYLKLEDQLLLTRVCRDLKHFMEDRFRRKCKKIQLFDEFWSKDENEIYIRPILKATVDTLEKLQITANTIMENKIWFDKLLFSKVICLCISIKYLNYNLNEVIPFIAKLFPNLMKLAISGDDNIDNAIELVANFYPKLKTLKLLGNCNGENVRKLENLEKLHIHTGSYCFSVKLLSNLARAPKLKNLTYLRYLGIPERIYLFNVNYVENLQELTLHNMDYENLQKWQVFKKMKNLRKITQYSYPFYYTLNLEDKLFYRRIDGFSTSRRYSTNVQLVMDAPKLRRIWLNLEASVFQGFCKENVKPFNSLEELYFIKSRAIEETQQYIMTIVSRSPKLCLLDISGTKFNIDFVENLLKILKWKQRTNDLILRCHKTNISPRDLWGLHLPKNLKISFDKIDYDLPTRNIISFQYYLSDELTIEE